MQTFHLLIYFRNVPGTLQTTKCSARHTKYHYALDTLRNIEIL